MRRGASVSIGNSASRFGIRTCRRSRSIASTSASTTASMSRSTDSRRLREPLERALASARWPRRLSIIELSTGPISASVVVIARALQLGAEPGGEVAAGRPSTSSTARRPGNAFVPASDETFTMWPRPARRMPGITARHSSIGATQVDRDAAARSRRPGARCSAPVRSTPALLTSTSIGPSASMRATSGVDRRGVGEVGRVRVAAEVGRELLERLAERATSATRAPACRGLGRESRADPARRAGHDDPRARAGSLHRRGASRSIALSSVYSTLVST